jgi:glucan-binding YG repeat protein
MSHHIGSKGYVAKIPEWKKKIGEVVSAGNPNLVEDIEERTMNWLLARSELTQDSKLFHKKKGVATVQEKAVQLTEKKKLGLFKSDMENDILSGALSNVEHTGCICGVASQMPWKVDFPNDAWSYTKHDRYKRNLEDAIEEKMNSMFETKFRSYMQILTQERSLELQQITQNLSSSRHLSSIGSTVEVPMWYLIDDITVTRLVASTFPSTEWETKQKRLRLVWPCRDVYSTTIPFQQNMLRCWFVRSLT